MTSPRSMLCTLVLATLYLASGFHFIAPHGLWYRRSTTFLSSDAGAASVVASPKIHQVYIGNLPPGVSESDIAAMIRDKVGETFKAVRIAKDVRTGDYRGYGYIDFEQKEDAESAVSALAGADLSGNILKADIALERPPRTTFERAPLENSCFIGNLDFSVSEEEIMQLCNERLGEGKALKVRLAFDRVTGKRRGFGHIDFVSPEEARRAIETLNGTVLGGRELRIDRSVRKEPGSPGTNSGASSTGGASRFQRRTSSPSQYASPDRKPPVRSDHSVFVGNLPWSMNEGMMTEMLDELVGRGTFSRIRIAKDAVSGRMKGYAHVDFADQGAAARAVEALNDLEVEGRQLRADHAQRKTAPADGRFGSGASAAASDSGPSQREE